MATPAAVLNILVTASTSQATAALTKTNTQLKATQAQANATSGAIGGKLASAAKVGGAALGVGLVYGAVKAIKVGAEFEKQMDSLGAVTQASTKDMAKFEKQALRLGQKTAYSASEAAAAQIELAKGGLAVKDILGGALPAALTLAAAGELELADAAETTVNAMKLFELRGRDASKVADMLATAANTTTADVADFAMALKMGGSAAKQAGLDLNDTVTILEALAEAGIKNSDAGTSMKTAILQLLAPTEKQAALADKLNISFVDQAGNMRDAAGIADQLRGALDGYTNAQRVAALKTLAGTDGFRTLAALYDAGSEKLDKLTKANAVAGTAQEIAAEKMDNTAGSVEQLSGAFETLGIKVFGVIGPVFRDTVDAATTAVTGLTDVLFSKKGIKASGELADAFRALGRGIKGVVEDVILPVVRTLGPGMLRSLEGVGQALQGFVNFIAGVLTLDLGRAWDGIKDIFGGIGGYFLGVFKGAAAIVAAPVKALAKALTGPIKAGVNALKSAVVFAFDKILGAVSTALGAIADAAGAFDWLPGIGGKLGALADAARGAQGDIDGFRESLRGDGAERAKVDALESVQDAFRSLGRIAKVSMGTVDEAMGDTGKAISKGAGRIAGELKGSGNDTDSWRDKASKNFDKTGDASGKLASRVTANTASMANAVGKGLETLAANTSAALKDFGAKPLKFTAKSVGKSVSDGAAGLNLRTGGLASMVPGQAPGDRHVLSLNGRPIANVESREGIFVGNRNLMGAMAEANAAVPRFAVGGMVDPAGPGTGIVNKAIAGVVGAWSQRYDAAINYGYDPGGGHLSPGHNVTGTATDTGPAAGWGSGPTKLFESGLRAILGKVDQILYGSNGVGTPYPNHGYGNHAHIEWGMHPDVQGAIDTNLARVILGGPDGILKTGGQGALDMVRKAGVKLLQRKAGQSGGADLGDVSGSLQQIAQQMVAARWGAGQWPPFNDLVNRESGWDPTAVNPSSGAAGLAQALPPSKYPPGAWPYQGKESAVLQLQWMTDYIAGRYGDPAGAIAFHDANNWYARGGQVNVPGLKGGGKADKKGDGRKFPKLPEGTGFDVGALPAIGFGPSGPTQYPGYFDAQKASKLADQIAAHTKEIAELDEILGLEQTLADLDGTFSAAEIDTQVRLNGQLLGDLMKSRDLASSGLKITKKGLRKAEGPNKKALKAFETTFAEKLVDMEGVTGRGGRIFDTLIALRELSGTERPSRGSTLDAIESQIALAGLTPDTADDIAGYTKLVAYWDTVLKALQSSGAPFSEIGSAASSLSSAKGSLADLTGTSTAALRIDELVRFAEALRYSGLGSFAGGFDSGGSIGRGQWGIVGERRPEIVTGPATVHSNPQSQQMLGGGPTTIYADLYIGGEKIAEKVRAEIREQGRESLNDARAGVVA